MDISSSQLVWMISAGIGIMALLALSLVVLFMYSRRKILQEQITQQKLRLSHQFALNEQVLQTQENERRRIAKDLHDDVGSKLNVSLLYLHQLENKLDLASTGPKILSETKGLLNGIIQTTRNISHDLLPPTLETLGSWAAIKELAMDVNGSEQAFIKVNIHANEDSEPSPVEGIHLYRGLQELIKNSLSHGKATQIDIEIRSTQDVFEIDYTDNGSGFDSSIVQTSGLGMANIENRFRVIGKTIRYESDIGKGTKAFIREIS